MKIAILTGSRADYGLLEPLIKEIKTRHTEKDNDYRIYSHDLKLIVTGSHLADHYGQTVQHIKHKIARRFPCVVDSSTPQGVSNSCAAAISGFSQTFADMQPDIVVILGDRYEMMAGAIAAHIANIPIAHIHGGEVTAGAYDDAFRHSITKMSSLHFVAAEPYRERVVQLGEYPSTVFNVGALGCDGLCYRGYRKPTGKVVCLFHPETVVRHENGHNYTPHEMLTYDGHIKKMVWMSGSHDGGAERLQPYRKPKYFKREDFLKICRNSDALIGNSSAGIIEMPPLGVPTINIGDRQKGRLMAGSIIQADATTKSIDRAIEKLYSDEFQEMMEVGQYDRPYRGGNVAQRILSTIEDKFESIDLRKGFYDL